MYIGRWWEVGWFDGLTELLFLGDAKLARERGLAGCVFDLTELLFRGDAELARGAIPLAVFLEFVGRMIYDTSRSESHKQSLFDRWRRQLTNQK